MTAATAVAGQREEEEGSSASGSVLPVAAEGEVEDSCRRWLASPTPVEEGRIGFDLREERSDRAAARTVAAVAVEEERHKL